ncbi:MAG: 16S rRNA (guanine(527)-N(7))-methyltransferase RsmG [Bacteroidia bacterium]
MTDLSHIIKYFPQLSTRQLFQFAALFDLYKYWNERVNVISRKDIDYLYENHVLHSLAIAKIISFNKNANVMDAGTGGGFPGIPLAIYFPETKFVLVDSVGKKIKVVNEIISSLELKNITAINERIENINMKFDFIISRATSTIDELMNWTQGKYKRQKTHDLPSGLFALKGGNLNDELKKYASQAKVFNIIDFFSEDFFETKKIAYIPA